MANNEDATTPAEIAAATAHVRMNPPRWSVVSPMLARAGKSGNVT
jgi:hypothetical protein